MASCVRNVCAKNRENPSILLKVTIDNVGVPFLRHSVDSRNKYDELNEQLELLCNVQS